MRNLKIRPTKLDQIQIFEEHSDDPLKSDFQKIMRTVPNRESDYSSHNMHFYPAKFIPYYPQIFIRHLTSAGDVVIDPMCGAGTTIIEACLYGREAYGIEIDPIGHLVSKVSVTPIKEELIRSSETKLFAFLSRAFAKHEYKTIELPSESEYPNHQLWFRDTVLQQLLLIRNVVLSNKWDRRFKDFALLCLSSIVRTVSNADPRDIFPQRDLNQKVRPEKNVFSEYLKCFQENKRRIVDFSGIVRYGRRGLITSGDAREMPYEDKFADLIFTSPPYAYAIDYARVHQLSTLLFIMNNETLKKHRKKYIGTDRITVNETFPTDFTGFEFAKVPLKAVFENDKKCGTILYNYFCDLSKVTKESFRVLKPGGHLVYVIGNSTIKKTPFLTDEVLTRISTGIGFKLVTILERPYYVYRMARNRNNHSNTIKKDIFIVLKR